MRERGRYIVVEGPIGVGKRELAEMLAQELDAKLMLEQGEENPFLSDFYTGGMRNSFQTQLYFLLHRWRQQEELFQPDLFNRHVISDYLFSRDQIFAELTLSAHELRLYNQIREQLVRDVVKPDLVVYLWAPFDVLLRRVQKRPRKMHEAPSSEYLDRVVRSFNDFFFNYHETPLLMVNVGQVDLFERPEEFRLLFEKIQSIRGGVHYFNPSAVLQFDRLK
mgnify:CR=1 FL=1